MAGRVKSWLKQLDEKLHEKNTLTNVLERVEKKTGVRRLHITIGAVLAWALYMIVGRAAELVCNAIGFMYPAYASLGALETPQKDDDTNWLTYWVVFACLCTAEFFSDFILFYIPMYWLLKCAFLIWCFLPIENNGSKFVFTRLIRPIFLKNKAAIDETLNKVASAATGFAESTIGAAAAKVAGSKAE